MRYSIYFALIKKISALLVHFPHKTYFKSCNARRATHPEKLMVFHDAPCVPPNLKGLNSNIETEETLNLIK